MRNSDLKPGIKLWLGVIGLMNIQDGISFLLFPDAVRSTAYDWARLLMPGRVWGALFLVLGIGSWTLLYSRARALVRLVMLLQTTAFVVFSVSIFGLTFKGSVSAITGANKWGTFALLGLWLMGRPIKEEAPQ